MPGGRVAKELISVLGTVAAVSTGAYLVTRPRPAVGPDLSVVRLREFERRLAVLEQSGAAAWPPAPVAPVAPAGPGAPVVPAAPVGPVAPVAHAAPPDAALPEPVHVPVGRMHKPYTVTHYENLAKQVAHERQIAELERRLAAMEAMRGGGTPLLNGIPKLSGTAKLNGGRVHRERRHG
jgi:hypothetical protein